MANGIVIRPEVGHADIAALSAGYSKMQAFSDSDNRGWIYWAEYHGFNRYECWHHARVGNNQFSYDLFLPWHRAYLLFFANAVRDQNEDAILPWWDWTQQSGVPAAFTSGGQGLVSGPMPAMATQPGRQTTRNPGSSSDLPSPSDVDAVLALNDFRDFSNQLQDIHDGVHGWVGGDMGSIGTSAFDPIFWSHHAMIDRLWYLWQLRHGVNNIPSNYLSMALFPGYTVGQVLDVRSLGYDYATSSSAEGSTPPDSPSQGNQGASDDTGSNEPAQPPTAGKVYVSKPIPVSSLDRGAKRYDVEFHHVDHAGASYEGRVYLNNPDANEETGKDDPSYAGSYHIFGHGGCLGDDPAHCLVKPRRPYDPRPEHPLTPAKKVVIATEQVRAAVQAGEPATVTVVPIVEPLPYADVNPKLIEDPVEIGYVRLISYR